MSLGLSAAEGENQTIPDDDLKQGKLSIREYLGLIIFRKEIIYYGNGCLVIKCTVEPNSLD